MLWSGLSSKDSQSRKIPNARDKLHCQMQALSFLLLLNTEPPSSKVPIYTEDVINEFESSCGVVTIEDASFLLQEMHMLLNRCWTGGQGCEGNAAKQYMQTSNLYVLLEMVLIVVKVLCVTGHYNLASSFLKEIESKMQDCGDCQSTVLLLAKWAIKLNSAMKAGEENSQGLTECARALRSLSTNQSDLEAHAVLEGCGLVMWAVESGHKKGLTGPALLAWFSFLEEHQNLIVKIRSKVSVVTSQKYFGEFEETIVMILMCGVFWLQNTIEAEGTRLQQALCFNIYQGFVFAYDSMSSSQVRIVFLASSCKIN